jgi:uncharacterized protein YkwD
MFRASLAGCLAVVLLNQGAAPGQSVREWNTSAVRTPAEQPAAGVPDAAQVRQLLLADANGFRGQEHRLPLRRDPKLEEAAAYFAHYLAKTDLLSHTADGKEPWERAAEFGYRYCIILENIAYEYNSEGFTARGLAEAFMEGWEHSPGHRRNLLDPDVSDTGIGVARSPNGYYYAVQMFGRPRSQAIVFEITNQTGLTVPFTIDKHRERIRPGYTMTYTRCRPPTVELQPVGKPSVFHPTSGAHLLLVPRNGGYQVQHE